MDKNELYHRPKLQEDGYVLLKLTKKSNPIKVKLYDDPKKILTIGQAIAFITKYPHNLMRVSGYKCNNHNKYHRFSFHSCVSLGFPAFYGFDKEKDVIEFARNWNDR